LWREHVEQVASSFKGAKRAAVARQLEVLEVLGTLAAFADAAGVRRWGAA
jgi:hypothetical protein